MPAISIVVWASSASAQVGAPCSSTGYAQDYNLTDTVRTLLTCTSGGTYSVAPVQIGSTIASCNSTNAGIMQWTGSSVSPNNTLELCNGSSWTTLDLGGTASIYLGTSAIAANPQISGDATSGFYTPAASTVAVTAGGKEAMQWNTASNAVNYVNVTPAATGSGPTIASAGTDTNIDLNLTNKGTGNINITTAGSGSINLKTTGGTQAQVANTASAVNYVKITGAATGSGPTVTSAGSDTNINLTLNAKGTGDVIVATGSSLGVNTAVPQSTMDVSGNVAIGSYAGSTAAPSNGLIVSGTVGIGTTTPGLWHIINGRQALTISGTGTATTNEGVLELATNAPITSGQALGWLDFLTTSTTVAPYAMISATTEGSGGSNDYGGYLAFDTKGDNASAISERMRIDDTGNVGIADMSPNALLALGAAISTIKVATFDNGTGNLYGIGVNTGQLTFGAGITATGTPQMVLTSGGYVGIGTTAPSNLLTLYGADSSEAGPHIEAFTATDATYPVFQQLDWTHDNVALNFDSYFHGGGWYSSSSTNNYQIYKRSGLLEFNYANAVSAGSAVTWNTGLVLNSSGDVGIADLNPNALLSLGSAITTIKVAAFDNGTGNLYGIGVNTGQLTFGAGITATGTPQMVLTNGGSVGIGSTSPQAKLDVNGAIDIGGVNGISYPSSDTTAGASIAIGPSALANQPASAAYSNVAIGYQTLNSASMTTAATNNTAIGYQALNAVTSGNNSTAVGYKALKSSTSAPENTAVGATALSKATGSLNTALGSQALSNLTSGGRNVAVGHTAATAQTTSSFNTAVGDVALFTNVALSQNTAVGHSALNLLNNSTAGNGNDTAVGKSAGSGMTTGTNNTVIGQNSGGTITSGGNNLVLGYSVASTTLTTGSSNILIGTSSAADTPASGTSNFLDIGNVIFATGMTGTLTSPAGSVGIGTTNPQATLDIAGYTRLAKNSSQPVACSSTNDGAIALTALYTLCVCNGGFSAWVQANNGTTACSW